MTIEIRMPALSPTMETGTLSKWLVSVGDEVSSGDLIAEIETDKATMEVEASDDGRMGRFVVEAGTEDVAVGALIAVLLEDGEDASAADKVSDAPAKAKKAEPTDQEVSEESSEPKKSEAPAPNTMPDKVPAKDAPLDDDERVFASPLARRLAKQAGIDLSGIKGSGPGGRIVKKDIEPVEPGTRAPAAAPAEAPAPAPVMEAPRDTPYEEVKLSNMRKVIAQRLTLSKQTVPHYYLTVDIELDRLLELRKELNSRQDVKLSVNDFLIRAMGLALKKVPDANVQYAGDKMYHFSRADVSVAVAIEGGLITPVIRAADSKGLAAISSEMKDLAAKARDGKLAPEDYQGGTISLSNLGMFGIRQFDAVINPPQAAILAVGAGEARAVVRDGALAIATVMTATLSCDHRAIDGAVGANYLAAFKNLLQDPLTMLL